MRVRIPPQLPNGKDMIVEKTIYRVETKDIIGIVNIDIVADSLDEALKIFKELAIDKKAKDAPILSIRQWAEVWIEVNDENSIT